MDFYDNDEAQSMGWNKVGDDIELLNDDPLTNDQINKQKIYLKEQPTALYNFLESEGIGKKIAQDVNTARVTAFNALNDVITTGAMQSGEIKVDNNNEPVIGGKRTKRAKTSNRKTKNKRKKPHKRN